MPGLPGLTATVFDLPHVTGFAARMIAAAERRSLNVEGAFRHILTDLFAFIATAIAGAVILISGFDRADGIASLLIAGLMLWAAYGLLRDTGRVFMEAAPPGLDPQQIGRTLAAAEGVVEVVHPEQASRILLVDDHVDTRQMYAEFLGMGFEVLTAPDGEQAGGVVLATVGLLVTAGLVYPQFPVPGFGRSYFNVAHVATADHYQVTVWTAYFIQGRRLGP